MNKNELKHVLKEDEYPVLEKIRDDFELSKKLGDLKYLLGSPDFIAKEKKELYDAYIKAGFTKAQAMEMIKNV